MNLHEWAITHLITTHPGYGELAAAFPCQVEDMPAGVLAATNGEVIRVSPAALTYPPCKYLWILGHELAHIMLHHTRPWKALDDTRLRAAMEIEADQNVPDTFEPVSATRSALASSLSQQGINTLERIYEWLGKNPTTLDRLDDLLPGVDPETVRVKVLGALSRGLLPGSWRETIGKLSTPTVAWQDELAHYIGTRLGNPYYASRFIHHYLEMGLPVPPVEYEISADVALAIDSSGSMKGEPIRLCLSQIRGLWGLVDDLDVYIADAAIQDVVHLSEVNDDEIVRLSQRVKGYGGTDFRPVFEALRSKPPQVLVYLTDADGIFPEAPDYDVLWVTTTDLKVPFGKRVRIPVFDLEDT